MKDVLVGAAAGCAATVPMTWAMGELHHRLPAHERYPLPPRTVTMRAAGAASVTLSVVARVTEMQARPI